MKVKTIAKQILRKIINPKTYFVIRRIKNKKKNENAPIYIDPYLKAYTNMFPGESLHLPYFANPDVVPESLSFHDLMKAARAYTDLVTDKVVNKKAPVLDVGCGLGELCKLLLSKGFKTVGLTPDHFQYTYIKKNHPEIEIIKNSRN